jgi:hypothetical protein
VPDLKKCRISCNGVGGSATVEIGASQLVEYSVLLFAEQLFGAGYVARLLELADSYGGIPSTPGVLGCCEDVVQALRSCQLFLRNPGRYRRRVLAPRRRRRDTLRGVDPQLR